MNALQLAVNSDNSVCLEELRHKTPTAFPVCSFITPTAAGSETTMTSSSGQTFQITGTSVGGKVVTTKLSVPANSKIVTVNVPTSQGGTAAFGVFLSRCLLTLASCSHTSQRLQLHQQGPQAFAHTRVAICCFSKLHNGSLRLTLPRHLLM